MRPACSPRSRSVLAAALSALAVPTTAAATSARERDALAELPKTPRRADAATARTAGENEARLLDEINRVRSAHRLPAMRADRRLALAARWHSAYMLRTNYFGHHAFTWRIKRARARGPIFSENIAMAPGTTTDARLVVQMWMTSPPHRANLLRRGFRRIGLAAPVGPFQGTAASLVTAEFAGR
jgi:uncharacterized protein YkwD